MISKSSDIEGRHTFGSVTEKLTSLPNRTRSLWWWIPTLCFAALFGILIVGTVVLFIEGVGIWGLNIPVGWGFAIINFVWWVGIGHAGTFISAILLVTRQKWRRSISRFTEFMTLMAITCAGLFPLLHLGRPGLFYWLIPYPNTMNVQPQFLSPLIWDFFALLTYGLLSLMFWYLDSLPDFATWRDQSRTKGKRLFYGILAMGWRGSNRHWIHFHSASQLLAGLATVLVISVHSIVSLDFAVSIVPGWHSTIFPPYFVAGAIFSGFAMVLTFLIPLRKILQLEDFITQKHLNNMALLMLTTGWMVGYGYIVEFLLEWYSGNPFDQYLALHRLLGPYALWFWVMIFCNLGPLQLLWWPKLRNNNTLLFAVALFVVVGMWLERFIIVITSLSRDFMPGMWHMFIPTWWDWGFLIGSIGLFGFFMFLFMRFIPFASIHEIKGLLHEKQHEGESQ